MRQKARKVDADGRRFGRPKRDDCNRQQRDAAQQHSQHTQHQPLQHTEPLILSLLNVR